MKRLLFTLLFLLPMQAMDVPTRGCTFCYETATSSIVPLTCGHEFHVDCLAGIVQSNGVVCPTCDEPLAIDIQETDGFLYSGGKKVADDATIAQLLTCQEMLGCPQSAVPKGECSICMEDFDAHLYRTPCAHTFHKSCFSKWMAAAATPKCPLCNRELKEEETTQFSAERALPRVVDVAEQVSDDERVAHRLQYQETIEEFSSRVNVIFRYMDQLRVDG